MSILYIVATPIGNLDDMSPRAITILKSVHVIAAEDTRHSQKLLQHFNITTPLISYHEHNERQITEKLIRDIKNGQTMALISDAGTPLISDPGYHLAKMAHEKNITVIPIPGACAAITALSASGLASNRFIFEGFLPSTPTSRKSHLEKIRSENRTLIFYEAPHRLEATVKDMVEILGETREATLARELTKTFETIRKAPLKKLYEFILNDPNQTKGECVLVVAGADEKAIEDAQLEKAKDLLKNLLAYLPLKKAVKIAADLLAVSKNVLYDEALKLQPPPDA